MNKYLYKIFNLLWDIFVIFVFLSCVVVSGGLCIVIPKLGIGLLLISIGFKLIDWYSSRSVKGDKNENL